MSFARAAALAAALALVPLAAPAAGLPVLAERNGILIEDGRMLAVGANAPTGAVYMRITNETSHDDTLVEVRTDAAARAMLHASEMTDGIARMRPMKDGIPVPAGQTVLLQRGGSHVMLMGLTAPLAEGGTVDLTLVFATAGAIPVAVPVSLDARADAADMDHSEMPGTTP